MDTTQKGGVSLSEKEIIRIAARAGAKAYSEAHQRNEESRKDNRLRNIDMLLDNYRAFKAHAKNAVFSKKDIYLDDLAEIEELMWETGRPEIIANAIFKSAARTRIIVAHIDTAVEVYEAACAERSNEAQRRCRSLKRRYITEEEYSPERIAEYEHIDVSTVRRDIIKAKQELAPFLFGIDGII